MTRGKIIFIDKNGKIYNTTEFNGDMYPDKDSGYGREIVEYFQNGRFSDLCDFERFVRAFDKRHFGYAEETDDNLFSLMAFGAKEGINTVENYTDYLYIINRSEECIRVHNKDGDCSLAANRMMIVHYDTLVDILDVQESSRGVPLSKQEFVKIIGRLQDADELVSKVNQLFRESRENVECDFCNGASLQISHESLVVDLLQKLMRDKYDNISYFIYELDYGKKYEEGAITNEEGIIDMSTPEALYNYLIKEFWNEVL